jgi:hypothetical protein
MGELDGEWYVYLILPQMQELGEVSFNERKRNIKKGVKGKIQETA